MTFVRLFVAVLLLPALLAGRGLFVLVAELAGVAHEHHCSCPLVDHDCACPVCSGNPHALEERDAEAADFTSIRDVPCAVAEGRPGLWTMPVMQLADAPPVLGAPRWDGRSGGVPSLRPWRDGPPVAPESPPPIGPGA